MITNVTTTVEAAAMFEKGQRVSVSTRDHGRLAARKVKSFTGIVEMVSPMTTANGTKVETLRVRLEPTMATVRYFDTLTDIIEVIG